jgi:hypothetical protein
MPTHAPARPIADLVLPIDPEDLTPDQFVKTFAEPDRTYVLGRADRALIMSAHDRQRDQWRPVVEGLNAWRALLGRRYNDPEAITIKPDAGDRRDGSRKPRPDHGEVAA